MSLASLRLPFRETQAKSHHCAALRDAVCTPRNLPYWPQSSGRWNNLKHKLYKESKGTLVETVLPPLECLHTSFPNSASKRVALLRDTSAEWHLGLGGAASTIAYFLASPLCLIPSSERTWEASLRSKPWPRQPIPRRSSGPLFSAHCTMVTLTSLLGLF